MLIIGITYAVYLWSCNVPGNRDITPVLREVTISAAVNTISTMWRYLRSSIQICDRSKKSGDDDPKVLCPDHYPCVCCLPLLKCALKIEWTFITLGIVTTGFLAKWTTEENQNFPVNIYRSDFRVLNISGTIIPPNGSYVYLEQISAQELNSSDDVFCLSEFEYRKEDYRIYYNFVQLLVISEDGYFCTTVKGLHYPPNLCSQFYNQSVLYYGYTNDTGEISFEPRVSL